MRVFIFQKTVPSYRVDFFDTLYTKSKKKICVYSPCEKLGSLTDNTLDDKKWLNNHGKNFKISRKYHIDWQTNLNQIEILKDDIVVIPGNPRDIGYYYLLLKLKMKGIKVIVWTQYWSHTSTGIGFYIRKKLFNFFNGIIFYTEKEVSLYLESLNNNIKMPIAGLNNGLNFDLISSFSTNYNAHERNNNILFIGRLTKKSNVGQLITAIGMCKSKEIKLHIIGSGEDINEYKKLTKIYQVEAIFYGSLINEDSISKVMNKCTLFVYPGAVGLSLIHAMSYGLPSIIHDDFSLHGPESAALVENLTGYIFEKDSATNLSQTIDMALSNKENLNKISFTSKELMKDKFNIDNMSNEFLSLIEKVENQ